jgi:N4-gp56 family major capsid protein
MSVMGTAQVANFYTLYQLSRDVRVASQTMQRFRQFARPESDYGPHQGRQLRFVKLSNLVNRGRAIGEFDDVPVTQFNSTYGYVEWTEWSNSVQWNQLASMISMLSFEDMHIQELKNDAAQTLDIVAAQPFITAAVIYTPTGTYSSKGAVMTVNGTAGAVSTRPFQIYDLKNVVQTAKRTFLIPGWKGTNDYMCVCCPEFTRGIIDDPEFIEKMKYADPEMLLKGEIGKLHGVRFIEETNVLQPIPGNGGQAVFFGDDPVIEVETYPLELQAGIDGNFSYGRVKSLRWTWMGGFAVTWSFPTDGATRIITVGSL